MAVQVQLRHDTIANWASNNPTLMVGEVGIESDAVPTKIKIGNGTQAWNSLAYYSIGPTGATGAAGLYSTQGTATLDFGAAPGTQYTTVTVTGQSGITTSSPLVVFMRSDDTTADHNAMEHAFVRINPTGGTIVNGVGFTITAVSNLRLTGTFLVRWAY